MAKTVLVTGSSRGIGAACAEKFAELGCNVVINYKSDEKSALALEQRLTQSGGSACAIRADVSDAAQIDLLFSEAEKRFCGVDILVNNAGISRISMINDVTEHEWDEMFALNTKAAYLCAKRALAHMIHQKWGRIINISSMWGLVGASCEVPYSASKAALIGFTKALAKELAPSGITVNAVAPGIIETQMNAHLSVEELAAFLEEVPVGRVGLPKEVAHAVAFLAHEDSAYITAQTLAVDGGIT